MRDAMMMSLRYSRWWSLAALILVAAAIVSSPAEAQRRRGGFGGFGGAYIEPNIPYDGRFTFARIRYEEVYSNGWAFDYPDTERNFATILREITSMKPYMEGGNVFTFDDPELFRFPIAYVSEPGFWYPSRAEAEGLRDYLAKGGFVIFDDFQGPGQWLNFVQQMQRVLPAARIVPLEPTHPIFDAFFKIDLSLIPGGYGQPAVYYGIYQDNDPRKRLIAIINFENDVGEMWEWSTEGFSPVPTNEAYKLGVNYLIYALTH